MKINVLNRQSIRKPNAGKIKAAIKFFMNKAAAGSNWKELSLVLTDDAGIRKIKRQFFDIDCVTDVISFSLPAGPGRGGCLTAEIVVNAERARLEGRGRKGVEHEFALYLAHGCDHLAGHDDRTAQERKKMRRRELRWLKQAVKLNLLSGLFKLF